MIFTNPVHLAGCPGGSDGNESACSAGDWGSIPGLEMAIHSSIPAWRIHNLHLTRLRILLALTKYLGFPAGTEVKVPDCQCKRCKRRRFNSWLGKSPGQRNLAGYRPRGCKRQQLVYLMRIFFPLVSGLVGVGEWCWLFPDEWMCSSKHALCFGVEPYQDPSNPSTRLVSPESWLHLSPG